MRYETNMSLHFVGSFLLSRLQFGLSSCNINCFIKELFRKCYNSQDFYTAVCNNRKNAFYSPCLRVWDIATWNNWCTDAESLPCTSNNSVRMVLRNTSWVCIRLGTTVVHDTAQNSSDNLPSCHLIIIFFPLTSTWPHLNSDSTKKHLHSTIRSEDTEVLGQSQLRVPHVSNRQQ